MSRARRHRTDDLSKTRDASASGGAADFEEIDVPHHDGRTAGGRFVRGRSGNPKGRPRKQPEAIDAMMLRVLDELVSVKQGATILEMSFAETIFRAMCHKGTKDPRVGRDVFKLVFARTGVIAQEDMDVHLIQGQEALDRYMERLRRQIAADIDGVSGADATAAHNDNPEVGGVVDPPVRP